MRWLLRHDRAVAALGLALAVLVYFAPLLAGRQMGHGYLLPRGARSVDVELDRSDLHAGAVVSSVSLLATLGLGLASVLRSRRRRRAAPTAAPPPQAAPG